MQDTWDSSQAFHALSAQIERDVFDPELLEFCDPRLLAAKVSKYNEDNPSWDMAMQGPFQEDYWSACELELETLEKKLKAWTYVKRQAWMNVLPSTWAFKCKRRPDGDATKFKSRFCARGDKQIEGVDVFETWSPVVQWPTIRIMMILAAKLGLKSAQCDITAAFLHAKVPKDRNLFVHQPRGFRKHPDYVLKLSRFLYGMRDSPRYFFKYLTERLARQGLVPSDFDPCLFLSKDIIVLCYVDDLLVYAKTDKAIDDFVKRMVDEDVLLRKEDTAEGFLGVDIKRDGDKTILTQSGLAERVVSGLGLCSQYSTPVSTPAEQVALPRDLEGVPCSGNINYASIVGMLLYLCGHSRPDIAYAVHQCARYNFEPKRSHELALKRIGRYLKGTMSKGLILDPSDDYNIDCYPDADFAGLWGRENPDDPSSVRSRTGYVITLARCPVLWVSRLQPSIAMSTMESEYIALSQSCKDLFPVVDLACEMGSWLGLEFSKSSNMHVRVHEDNVGALTLGKLEPRRATPRSKHYAVKYHWFRSEIGPRNIQLVKISTEHQLGDMFTKGLGRIIFERLRNKLMGW